MSATAKSVSTLGVLVVIGVACVRFVSARDPLTRTPEKTTSQFQSPFVQTQLPYAGYGRITLLDEGSLLIRTGVRGDFGTDTAGMSGPMPTEVALVMLDTRSLELVQVGEDSFLDQSGTELRRRELSADEVQRTSVSGRRDVEATPTPEAVIELHGVVYLSFDPTGQYLRVAATEIGTMRTFHTTIALPRADTISSRQEGRENADLVEVPGAIRSLASDASEGGVASTGCSANCSQGSCSISCPGRCRASCSSSGVPSCECVGMLE